jgi:protein phosphatase
MIAEKDFAGRQTRGARALQEDAYAFSEIVGANGESEGMLVVVADGMGGHTAGERASELALKSFVEAFHRAAGGRRKRLSNALAAANDAIARELKRESGCEGMGTTLLAATITRDGIEWISVGDSPLYLCRGGTLTRLNEDHSLRPVLKEMAELGKISSLEPENISSGNVLRAALTGDEIALIDQPRTPVSLQEGDLILAATDGIHTLTEANIMAACTEAATMDASVVASNIVQAVRAVDKPRQDNTTVAVMRASVS